MRLRLLALLVVAVASGSYAGLADDANAGKAPVAVPLPTVRHAVEVECPVPAKWQETFRSAAADASLPLSMLVAVAKVESRFDARARSSAGAHGLLQVLPSTAAELELDARHPRENVLAGALYLRKMLDRFQSTELALAAYNAGPTAVELYGASPNPETIAYVANVTAEWRKIVGCA